MTGRHGEPIPDGRRVDLVIQDAQVATVDPNRAEPYGLIEDGVIVISDGRIVHVGPRGSEGDLAPARTRSAAGQLVTPGLVDCHTHLVFGGHRAREHELRLGGATYEEIARAGGGIQSTVEATRRATDEELLTGATRRLGWLTASGATTVEVKSGYGLDVDTELRMLRVARELAQLGTAHVTTTLLIHTVPTDRRDDRDRYVDEIVGELIPLAHAEGLADAVDVFCETIAFTTEETDRILTAAREQGMPVKVHAEQLSDQGAAVLAARHHALSADHLEHLTEAGASAMAAAGTVAVLVPGASHFLREETLPPVALLREHDVAMAVTTDLNPGTSPVGSLPLAMTLACTRFGLTPEEALVGATRNAARALGMSDRGIIAPGMLADLALWTVRDAAELTYWHGVDLLAARFLGGHLVHDGVR